MKDAYSKDAALGRELARNPDWMLSRPGRTITRLVARCRQLEREIATLRASTDRATWQSLVRERDAADLRALQVKEVVYRMRDQLKQMGIDLPERSPAPDVGQKERSTDG